MGHLTLANYKKNEILTISLDSEDIDANILRSLGYLTKRKKFMIIKSKITMRKCTVHECLWFANVSGLLKYKSFKSSDCSHGQFSWIQLADFELYIFHTTKVVISKQYQYFFQTQNDLYFHYNYLLKWAWMMTKRYWHIWHR